MLLRVYGLMPLFNQKKTREFVSLAIEAANHNPEFEDFKLGVIQT